MKKSKSDCVHRLGDGREIALRLPTLALLLNKNIKFSFCSSAEAPSGLSIDRQTKRLFAGCENKLLVVIDATNGKIIARLPIGNGCDGTAFDPALNTVYSSNGEGTLTVIAV